MGVPFGKTIPSSAQYVVFTDTVATGLSYTDVSEAQDGSILAWMSGNTYYVASTNGEKILLHPVCTDMFAYNTTIKSVDFGNADFRNVETIRALFFNCTSLTEIDLSGANLNRATSMFYFAQGCWNLKTIKLPTSMPALTNAKYAFNSCSSLTTIYAGDWTNNKTISDTNSVSMFYGCSNLVGAIRYNSAYVTWSMANTQTGYFTAYSE